MSSEVNGVNVSADNVFVCIKITYWVRVRRPRQVTAPTYSKNAAPLDQPPLPRKHPRSAPAFDSLSLHSLTQLFTSPHTHTQTHTPTRIHTRYTHTCTLLYIVIYPLMWIYLLQLPELEIDIRGLIALEPVISGQQMFPSLVIMLATM